MKTIRKGHNAERHYAKKFREMGYNKCCTTRASSRLLDNCMVDLNYIPFLVQIKAGKQKKLSYSLVLKTIREKIAEHLPEDAHERSLIPIIIHYKHVGTGRKRNEYDELVVLAFSDFQKLIKPLR